MSPLLALIALQLPTTPAKPLPDAVLGTVDGVPILASEVEPYLWAWKSKEVVTELARYRMVSQEAARRGITATDAETQAKYDEQIGILKTRLQPGQTVDQILNSQPGGPARLALVAKMIVLLDKMAGEFKPDSFVKVSTLAFPAVSTDTAGVAKATKLADAAYAKLAAGKSWDDVVKANTTNGMIGNAGDLGWRSLDIFPDTARAQLQALKPGGFTKPVTTPGGVQIFHVTALGPSATPAELADLKTQYQNGARNRIFQEIQQKSKIDVK